MKDYFSKVYKYGEFVKATKLFIALFTAIIAVDAINLPTIIINKSNILFFASILIGILVLVSVFLHENHIIELIKAKAINESDSYIIMIAIGCIIYGILLTISSLFKWYKLIIICITILLAIGLFIYRLYINKRNNCNEIKVNSNVYDLKDFIENEIKITNEYPILFAEKDVDYDLCDRTVIINQLYSSLKACCGSNYSFVIGLEGPWGSGKTTIINNVIKKIKQDTPEDFIVIDDFDPWTYNTQQALLTSLFDKILESTGIKYSNSSLKTITNILIKSIIGSNIAGNIAGNILFQNNAEDEVRKLKERICTHLEQNDKTMVVFIDNMDRASASNIIFLLKIISNIFDLNRIVYVLSYDKERVNEILNRNLNINKRYIEKIIQQEIKVTKLNRDKFHNIVSDCLYKLFGIYGVPNIKYKDFNYIIDFLAKYTDDIREFKRIMNSVCAVFSVKNGLYIPDLFTLELIRFVDNDLYEDIHRHPKYYVSADLNKNAELYATIFERKKFNDEGKTYFRKLQNEYGINILNLLSNIFPYVDRYLTGNDLQPEYDIDTEINKRIELNCGAASAKYFDLYFHFGENEYIMVSKIYNEFIGLILKEKNNNTPENIPELFDEFFDNVPIYYHYEIISKLWFERNDFEQDLNLPIFIGLVRNSQKFDKEQGFFTLSAYQRACAIMATLFSHLTGEEKTELIEYLKDYYKNINVYDEILYWLNSSSLYYDKKEQDAKLFEDMIINMFNKIIDTPIDIYSDDNYGYHNSWALLRAKRKVLNLQKDADIEITNYISAIMKPNYIYKILRDIIGMSTGSGGYSYYISQNSLKSFFNDENIIFEYLQQCPPSNQTEEFIYNVCEKYRSDEVDDWGNKSININHYVRLW